MNIAVSQETLAKALAASSRVATSKAGLPVLNNILLDVRNNHLVVASTNLELASVSTIGAKVAKPGLIIVPARILSDFVGNLPKGTVELESKGTNLTVSTNGYRSMFNGIDAEEFPEMPVIDEKQSIHYSLSVSDFKHAITQTAFACSTDVTRPVLTGVFWHSFEGWLYLVGTDGYRLAERRVVETESELQAIVPTTTLQEVMRVITDHTEVIDILFDDSQVRFRVGDTEITSRLIDGKYPDYRQLIPKTTTHTAQLATSDLVRTTKIASLFARDSGGSITLKTDSESQKVILETVASEVGENHSEITATVGESGSVSLNSRYLADVLSVLDEPQLDISFSGKLAPILVRPHTKTPEYTHIIMPLKS